jgi:hypothetical protein
MNLENDIKSRSLRMLRPVFDNWFQILKRYLDELDHEDCQWWYNERATLSSLAAAIWKADGIALEEYCTKKGKKSETWTGRCDLYFKLGRHNFACEAKQIWCAIGRRATIGIGFKKINDAVNMACREARNLDKDEGRRLGICFAIPYLPPSDSDKQIVEQQVAKWLKAMTAVNYSLIAWSFPEKTRLLSGYKEYIYPGTVVLIREIK